MKRRRCLAIAVIWAATLGPAGLAAAERPGWTARGARIELERVISTRHDLATRRDAVIAWLMGKEDEPLFRRPYGVAWDGSDLLVADPAAHRVTRVAGTTIRSSREGAVEDPVGVAVCNAGIFVTDARAGAVAVLNHNLQRTRWLASNLSRPTGIACSGDDIFVVETAAHRVLVMDSRGAVKRIIGGRGEGAGEFNYPTSIAVAGQFLFVGDTLNFRVQRIDLLTGAQVIAFGTNGDAAGNMPRVKGIAVDAQHHIWITDAHLDQIAIYTAEGEFLVAIGRTGFAPGELSFPAGIAFAEDGRIAVADSLNGRVQIFRLLGAGGME